MQTPKNLLKLIGKAALNAVGGGIAGDFVVDVLPEMANDVWGWWGKGKKPAQIQKEMVALAIAKPSDIHKAAVEAVKEYVADKPGAVQNPEEVQKAVEHYLTQVPAMVRRSLRHPNDPTGTKAPPHFTMKAPDDLMALLPTKKSRFQPGQRPLPGVDWELEELLGIGGFGEVWKARNPELDGIAPVALKFCLDATADKLLRHEATVLNRVMRQGKHPGIVPLHHTYLNANPPCLAYEYVAGGDLTGVIQQWHRQPSKDMAVIVEQATRIMKQLAESVAFAHEQEPPIVHRDLKPANILVQQRGAGELGDIAVRITDFGIGGVAAKRAIAQTGGGTTHGRMMTDTMRGTYTLLYASPQQMRGEPADPRDDVYALGVIWYQLLTGDLSIGCPGGMKWADRLEEQGMPAAQVKLLASCMEENPNDRPASAVELATALRGGRKTGPQPSLHLKGSEAEIFERYAAAKALYEDVKEQLERHQQAVQDLLWRKLLQSWHQERSRPANSRVAIPNSRAAGLVQIRESSTCELPEGQPLAAVLQQAGFSKERAEAIAASEYCEETELGMKPWKTLAKSQPDLAAKIQQLLEKGLTAEEKQEAIVQSVTGKVKKGFLERAAQYAETEEELQKLLSVFKPQIVLTQVTFDGDLERAYGEVRKVTPEAAVQAAQAD
jgi:serine/threonine protein kinase